MTWVPITPGGTPCTWLASSTEAEAWQALLKDAAGMPYNGIAGFKQRGYTVEEWRFMAPAPSKPQGPSGPSDPA